VDFGAHVAKWTTSLAKRHPSAVFATSCGTCWQRSVAGGREDLFSLRYIRAEPLVGTGVPGARPSRTSASAFRRRAWVARVAEGLSGSLSTGKKNARTMMCCADSVPHPRQKSNPGPLPVIGCALAPVGPLCLVVDSKQTPHYAVLMVTFCKNCAKVFVSIPRPGFLSLRLIRCTCGHSHIVAVRSLLEKPVVPSDRGAFPDHPGSPS